MKQAIVAAAQRGVAVIVSSHLLHLVEEICTRIVDHRRGDEGRGRDAGGAARQRREASGTTLERIFLDVTGSGR